MANESADYYDIDIDIFDPDSISEAINFFTEMKQDLDKEFTLILEDACNDALMTAKAEYAKGAQEENTDVEVTLTKQADKQYELTASGKDVFFLEYGAGDFTNWQDVSPWHNRMLYDYFIQVEHDNERGFLPGSWSIDHQQQYSMYGKWWHNGKEYVGIQPHRGMNEAIKALRRSIRAALRELFEA